MNAALRRNDFGFKAGWALILVLLALIPILAGYRMAPPGTRFGGFVGNNQNDCQAYLAWMRQAREGLFLCRDLFTTEPHRNAFFHPLFWLVGTLSRITGLGLLPVWYGVQLASVVLLVFAVYAFAASLTEDRFIRRLTLIVATTSAGVGWMVHPAPGTPLLKTPIDTWMVDASVFSTLTSPLFTLTASLACLLLSLARFRRRLDGGSRKDAAAAGLFALGVVAIHPYDLFVLVAVAGTWTLMAPGRPWKDLAVLALIPAPYAAYGFLLQRYHPVFSRVTWDMPVPGPIPHILGYGFPLLLAAVAVAVPSIRRAMRAVPLAAVWPAAVVVLLFLPVGYQRKFVGGVGVPLALLASIAVAHGLRSLERRTANPGFLRGVVVALVVLGSGAGSIANYRDLFRPLESPSFGVYLPDNYALAIDWLAEHSRPGDVVVAGPMLSSLIPGRTGDTVFVGHWAQTLDGEAKKNFLPALYSPASTWTPELLNVVLRRNRVRYVVVDARTAAIFGRRDLEGPFPFESLGKPVYRNLQVRIWELPGAESTSPTEPWPAGDWHGGPPPDPVR
jgi:hypothetical protein